MTNFNNVVGNAGEMLKDVADATAGKYAAARATVEEKLSEARSSIHDAQIALRGKATDAAHATGRYVRANPWQVLGITAAVGVIIGLLLRRRD